MDLDHYKEIIRLSNQESQGDINQYQDCEKNAITLSPGNLKTTLPLGGGSRSDDRPSEWLGTPFVKKSYAAKMKQIPDNPSPSGLDDNHDSVTRSPGFWGVSLRHSPVRSPGHTVRKGDTRSPSAATSLTPVSATRRTFKTQLTPTRTNPIPYLREGAEKATPFGLGSLKKTPSHSTETVNPYSPVNTRAVAGGAYATSQERVDHNKFIAASSAFQPTPQDFPVTRRSATSPKQEPKRNFTIRDSAKLKEAALHDVSRYAPVEDATAEIQLVMERLNKVSFVPLKDMNEKEKREWIGNQREGDSAIQNAFKDMLHKGLISSNLGPNRIEAVGEAIKKLEGLLSRASRDDKETLEEALRRNLRKLTTTSSGAVDTIQEAIGRLKKVDTEDKFIKEQIKDVTALLGAVVQSIHDGQTEQFAQVFEQMEKDVPDPSVVQQERARADMCEKLDRERAQRAKERFSPQNAWFLVEALGKLRRTKMNKRQAALTASFVRNLKHVESFEDETKYDDAVDKLAKRLSHDHKSEIIDVLKGLRRINLNDPERSELAQVVRGFGVGRVFRNEVAEAIMKLKKARMTPVEAKEAAGIMFNLRKAKTKEGFDIGNSREMASLRKMMAPERAAVIAEVFSDFANLKLPEKEIEEISAAFEDLGAETLQSTEYQVITTEYVHGSPVLVFNIPEGDDYAEEIESSDMAKYVKRKNTSKARVVRFWIELDHEEEAEEVAVSENNPFEVESDEEEKPRTRTPTPSFMQSDSAIPPGGSFSTSSFPHTSTNDPSSSPAVPPSTSSLQLTTRDSSTTSVSPRSSKTPGWTASAPHSSSPQSPKSKNLYQDSTGVAHDILSPGAEEKAKKIRFTKKPQWRHKKHNTTVVGEKRWRFEENYDVDEVIYSPLSRDQYDRRKKVGEALFKNLDMFAPLDVDKDDNEVGTKQK